MLMLPILVWFAERIFTKLFATNIAGEQTGICALQLRPAASFPASLLVEINEAMSAPSSPKNCNGTANSASPPVISRDFTRSFRSQYFRGTGARLRPHFY